jgi:hypothetical protein
MSVAAFADDIAVASADAVLVYSGESPTLAATLKGSDFSGSTEVRHVAINANTIAIGVPSATFWDPFTGVETVGPGHVYTFERPENAWVSTDAEARRLTHLDGAEGDEFGRAVALGADGTLLAGAPGVDGASADEGAAYVFAPSIAPPAPEISIADSDVQEGHAGTTTATFTVSLSAASTRAVTVQFATADGSATAGTDYSAHSGVLMLAPGETAATIAVAINGDTEVEPDETFTVVLANPGEAVLGDAEGTGTIQNDDLEPAVIAITETIVVTDSPALLPSAMLAVFEAITVADAPVLLPSAMIGVTETVTVSDAPVLVPSAMIGITETVTVSDAPVLLPSAMIGITETVTVTDTVPAAPVGNTPPGNLVIVGWSEPSGLGTVSVTLGRVVQPGETRFSASSGGAPLPEGYRFGDPPILFDITTTAQFTGPVTVCIDYGPVAYSRADAVRLFHFAADRWEDATVSVDAQTRTICGSVTSLSPFAVLEPVNRVPAAAAGPDQTIEATSPEGASVAVSGSGSDPDSDPITFTWTGSFGTLRGASVSLTLPIGTHPIVLTVSDGRGGTAADELVVSVVDTVAPSIAIASPSPATYEFNQAVTAAYSCADSGSGIATCTAPVAPGGPIDTAAEGTHAFVVTATDAAGNQATTSVTYTVTGRAGRMAGAGAITTAGRVEHKFAFLISERHVGQERGYVRYEVKKPKSGKTKARIDRFETTSIGSIAFWDNPAFTPAGGWWSSWLTRGVTVDSVVFSGTGAWNAKSGYTFEATAMDAGEPGGGRDTFAITIRDRDGAVMGQVEGVLDEGNIQSLRNAFIRDAGHGPGTKERER